MIAFVRAGVRSCAIEPAPRHQGASQLVRATARAGSAIGKLAKVVAAEPADLALDAAFLVCPFDAWLAVEDVQAIVRAECCPALGLDALPGEAEHLGGRRAQIVVSSSDTKINRYRDTLDAGGDPALIAGWISETTALKKTTQARLGLTEAPPQRMTRRPAR